YEVADGRVAAEPYLAVSLGCQTVHAHALSPDGQTIYYLSERGLGAYHLPSQTLRWSTAQATADGGRVTVSADGDYLATATVDGTVSVFAAESGKLFRKFPLDASVADLRFAPDGSRLAVAANWTSAAGRRPSLLEWDLVTGSESLVYEAPDRLVAAAYAGADDLVAASGQGALYRIARAGLRRTVARGPWVWHLEPGPGRDFLVTLRGGQGFYRNIANQLAVLRLLQSPQFLPEQAMRVSGTALDLITDREPRTIGTVPGKATAVAVLDRRTLLAGTQEGHVFRVSLDGEFEARPVLELPGGITRLGVVAPDLVLVGGDAHLSGVYRLEGDRLLPRVVPGARNSGTGQITAVGHTPDGRFALLAVHTRYPGVDPGTLLVIDLPGQRLHKTLRLAGGIVRDIHPVLGGRAVALALASGDVAIVDPDTGSVASTLPAARSIVFSLDTVTDPFAGRDLLVAGDAMGRLSFWDVARQERVHETLPLGAPVTSLSLGPLGADWWVAVGGRLETWSTQGLPGAPRERFARTTRGQYPEQTLQEAAGLKRAGRFGEALERYAALAALTPWDDSVLGERAELLVSVGQFQEALQRQDEIERLVLGRRSKAVDAAAVSLYRAGSALKRAAICDQQWSAEGRDENLVAAATHCLEALRGDPSGLAAHLLFQQILLKGGFPEVAHPASVAAYAYRQANPALTISPRPFALVAAYSALLRADTLPDRVRQLLDETWDQPAERTAAEEAIHRLLTEGAVPNPGAEAGFSSSERAAVSFTRGVANLAQAEPRAARKHFAKGVEQGDFLRLNRQRLGAMDGSSPRVALPEALIQEYQAIVQRLAGDQTTADE
ncbi:MAG: WD40 repeat domain-containing protein, partial [Deferrisomatales bacterium]